MPACPSPFRYGYQRAGDINDIPIMEAKASDAPGSDPFSELAKEKKDRVKKNKEAQLANLKKAAKVSRAAAHPVEASTGR